MGKSLQLDLVRVSVLVAPHTARAMENEAEKMGMTTVAEWHRFVLLTALGHNKHTAKQLAKIKRGRPANDQAS